MALTYPYTLANGAVADASKVQANFDAIKTYLDTTKLTTANLSTDKAGRTLTFDVRGTLSGDSGVNKENYRFLVPATETWVPVSVTLSFNTASAGTPAPRVIVQDDGGNVLSSALTTSTAVTPTSTTSFAITSIAGSSVILVQIDNSAAGGNDATDVTVTVSFVASLRASP